MPVLCLLLALLLGGCSAAPTASPGTASTPDVVVTRVQTRDIPVTGEYVGTVEGLVNAAVKAQVTGTLLRRAYREGSQVHKGQLLFEIDPRPAQAALAQAEGRLAQADGQGAQAQAQLASARAGVSTAHSQEQVARAGLLQAHGQYLQARAGKAQAQANQGKTRLDLERYRPLAEQRAVTRQDLDNARQADLAAQAQVQSAGAQVNTSLGTIKSAQAQIAAARSAEGTAMAQVGTAAAAIVQARAQARTAQAEVEAARLNLEFTRVVSPIDGIAGLARAQVGDLVGPSSDLLTTVSTVDPIKVEFTLPEQEYLEAVRLGHDLTGRPFTLIESDGHEYPLKGRFYAQDRNISVSTGAIRIAVTFPNPKRVLRPGQYARIRVIRYVVRKAHLVPQRAVSELQDRAQVAVVGSDHKVTMTTVKLGERAGSDWVIRSGLKGGETVIVEGLQKVTANATVNPVEGK